MATWIAHLRVAEQLLQYWPQLNREMFLVGNIAPDAGQLAEDKLSYVPPSSVSHFRDESRGQWKNCNLRFYRDYLANCDQSDRDRFSFLLGYFMHLFLDDLWDFYIYQPNHSQYLAEYQRDRQFVWQVKKDWYGLDLDFLAVNEDWSIWQCFRQARFHHEYLDFYPASSIDQKVAQITEFYESTDDWDIPGLYMNMQDMDQFVEHSVSWIVKGMQYLQESDCSAFNNVCEFLAQSHSEFRKTEGCLDAVDWQMDQAEVEVV